MIIILMGVSGAGKTTIGTLLARQLGWRFVEADDYHSEANRARMARGEGLTDADRAPWLERLSDVIAEAASAGTSLVMACSALKEKYRRQLRTAAGNAPVQLVYLKVPPSVAAERLQHRSGHYAKADLAPSQFADLEEPDDALVVDATGSPAEVGAEIAARLRV
ncbi:MAG TPA: gluconokinase [Gemmatimonadales bacterium]|nr:gluconokinase [Gemmatimonadales bacterium]